MTKYINEFDPKKSSGLNSVQEDFAKLKFNNILSCIAVCLVPEGQGKMIGVHFTFMNTRDIEQIKSAIEKMKLLGGVNSACSIYLVATYGHHSKSSLISELKKLTKNIFLCDIPPDTSTSASVDVKFEKRGRIVEGWIRPCVTYVNDDKGQRIQKTQDSKGHAISHADLNARRLEGKNNFLTDRDEKPWMLAPFKKV